MGGWGRKATHKYIGLKATIVYFKIIGYTDIYRIKGYSISGHFWIHRKKGYTLFKIYRKKGYTFFKNIQDKRLYFFIISFLPLHRTFTWAPFTPFTTILEIAKEEKIGGTVDWLFMVCTLNRQDMTNLTIASLVKMEHGWNFSISGLKIMVKSGLEKIFLKFLHAQSLFQPNSFTSKNEDLGLKIQIQ